MSFPYSVPAAPIAFAHSKVTWPWAMLATEKAKEIRNSKFLLFIIKNI
jgi:hypothetical protein